MLYWHKNPNGETRPGYYWQEGHWYPAATYGGPLTRLFRVSLNGARQQYYEIMNSYATRHFFWPLYRGLAVGLCWLVLHIMFFWPIEIAWFCIKLAFRFACRIFRQISQAKPSPNLIRQPHSEFSRSRNHVSQKYMYCPYCGSPISKDSTFCTHCGRHL